MGPSRFETDLEALRSELESETDRSTARSSMTSPLPEDTKRLCIRLVNAYGGVDACMDVAAYLRRQKEHLKEEARLVKDFSVFSFDHIMDGFFGFMGHSPFL